MRIAGLLVALVLAASCSTEGGQPDASVAPTDSSESTASSATPPVTQLSPEALDELGALDQPATGGESTGPLGGTVLELDTGDGTVQIGEGEVPASMEGLPVPDDLVVELSSSTDEAAGFSGISAESVDDLAEFYREELASAGFQLVGDEAPSASVIVLRFEGVTGAGDVALSAAPGGVGTTVIVTFSPLG